MTRPQRSVVLIVFFGWLLAGPLPAEEPKSSREQLESQLKRIGNFTTNARVKLTNGVVGRADAASGEVAVTPAQQCCTGNLNKLGESVVRMLNVLEELDACYARQGRAGSTAMTVLLAEEVRGYARSLQGFADAPTPDQALASVAAMTRGFNRMKTRLGDVEDCPSGDGTGAAGVSESGAP